jgi:hypothetical protein
VLVTGATVLATVLVTGATVFVTVLVTGAVAVWAVVATVWVTPPRAELSVDGDPSGLACAEPAPTARMLAVRASRNRR